MFRNQVIPVEINEKSSIDLILEAIEPFLRKDPQNPNISIEIEGKVGIFSLKKESQREFFTLLEQLSTQNFIILDDKIEKRFESGVSADLFRNNLDYFRRIYTFAKNFEQESNENEPFKEFLNNLSNREIRESLAVDYILGNSSDKKQRLTYEFGGNLSYLEKSNKMHIDLLHNSNIFDFFAILR